MSRTGAVTPSARRTPSGRRSSTPSRAKRTTSSSRTTCASSSSRQATRAAPLTLDWYAGTERTQRALLPRVPPIDRARTLLAWADRSSDRERAKSIYAKAADEYEAAGLVAQAAIARERGEDFHRARALWSRLSQVLGANTTDLYAAGLARFNLARTSLRTGDAGAAREAVVASVHLLEEAADRYETIGQRERAFDCYQVLIAIGRESGEFEHVLEGFVNVNRILREDHLRYYALQSYEEAVQARRSKARCPPPPPSRARWRLMLEKRASRASPTSP